MTDVQGTIIVSGAGKADLASIIECLNEYCWSDCDSKFAMINDSIRFAPYADYPTAFPRHEQFPDDYDNDDDDYGFDEAVLKELAAAVHKHIGDGYIELTAVSLHQNYGAWFEALRINANGVVKARRFGRAVLETPNDQEYTWKL